MVEIKLTPMTDQMYHDFFREYENDKALFKSEKEYRKYSYRREHVDSYIKRVKVHNRIPLAIMKGNQIVGEILFKDIILKKCASFTIILKNSKYINHGIGTQAEKLAIEYGFRELELRAICVDTLATNTRSQHVLEKNGFRLVREEDGYKYYCIERYMVEY